MNKSQMKTEIVIEIEASAADVIKVVAILKGWNLSVEGWTEGGKRGVAIVTSFDAASNALGLVEEAISYLK